MMIAGDLSIPPYLRPAMAMHLFAEDEETCVTSSNNPHVPVQKPGRDMAITVPGSRNNWYELTANRISG